MVLAITLVAGACGTTTARATPTRATPHSSDAPRITPTTSTPGAATTSSPPGSLSGSATVPSVPPGPPTTLAGVTASMLTAATGYLEARENADSYDQSSPTAWLGKARPYLTPAGYAGLVTLTRGGSGGFAYGDMHHFGWKLSTTSSCAIDQAAPEPTTITATLTCAVHDRTVTAAGAPVPATKLPDPWPYAIPGPPAILVLHRAGTGWLVAADQTGLAQ